MNFWKHCKCNVDFGNGFWSSCFQQESKWKSEDYEIKPHGFVSQFQSPHLLSASKWLQNMTELETYWGTSLGSGFSTKSSYFSSFQTILFKCTSPSQKPFVLLSRGSTQIMGWELIIVFDRNNSPNCIFRPAWARLIRPRKNEQLKTISIVIIK